MADDRRVIESEAEGKTKATFGDIRATLGVAGVGDLFERLAVYPWYLQLAWRNLKPNAETAYFHRMVRDLEDMALKAANRRRFRGTGEPEKVSPAEARLDLDAKLLAATAAMRYGTNGQLPKMLWLAPGDKQVIAPTVIQVQPAAEPNASTDAKLAGQLKQHAALCAESMPYRMEISSTACRQSGLSENEIDAVRLILNQAWDTLPGLVIAAAALTATGATATSSDSAAA